jgi:two-component system chemotaxis response regulator CheY
MNLPEQGTTRRPRALVIDDSRAVRSIIRQILADLSFEVHEAEDGQQALAKIDELGGVDLATVDWNMPVMNGLQFVEALRTKPEHASTCLVMVTTETDMDYVRRALEAGADEFVMKPFTRDVILDKLNIAGSGA